MPRMGPATSVSAVVLASLFAWTALAPAASASSTTACTPPTQFDLACAKAEVDYSYPGGTGRVDASNCEGSPPTSYHKCYKFRYRGEGWSDVGIVSSGRADVLLSIGGVVRDSVHCTWSSGSSPWCKAPQSPHFRTHYNWAIEEAWCGSVKTITVVTYANAAPVVAEAVHPIYCY
jgi:hypothetical protein